MCESFDYCHHYVEDSICSPSPLERSEALSVAKKATDWISVGGSRRRSATDRLKLQKKKNEKKSIKKKLICLKISIINQNT